MPLLRPLMKHMNFIYSMLPLWIAEGGVWLATAGLENPPTNFNAILLGVIVSLILLPYIAGRRLTDTGASTTWVVVGAASLSLVDLAATALDSTLYASPRASRFDLTLLIAILVGSLIQGGFGWVGRRSAKHTFERMR
jgi:hypothetical protein